MSDFWIAIWGMILAQMIIGFAVTEWYYEDETNGIQQEDVIFNG